MNLHYLYHQRIIDQNDSFPYFRLLMSTWRDSICENTLETSHVRFIHENFSVLITAPLDQIQQNLLRKETCQTTAKPADISDVISEYPTPTVKIEWEFHPQKRTQRQSRCNFGNTASNSAAFKNVYSLRPQHALLRLRLGIPLHIFNSRDGMPLPLYLACFLLLLLPATVKGATVPRSLLQSSPSNHVYYLKTPWPTTAYLIDARLSCASCGIRGGFDDVDADPGDKSGFARYLAKKRFMVQSSNCPKTLNGVRSSLFESRINFPGADQSRWLRGGKGDIQSVVFQVHCNSTTMDEDVGLIGENEALGSWNAAVRMRADKVQQIRCFVISFRNAELHPRET